MEKVEKQNNKAQKAAMKHRYTFLGKTWIYHRVFRLSGHYRFIGKNLLNLLLVIAIFTGIIWLINYLVDLKSMMNYVSSRYPTWIVVMTLFISESFTGILPLDFYIVWSTTLENPYLMLFILAASSYTGGIISWIIGTQLHKLPRVQNWIHVKFAERFLTFKKYGGLLIFISAMAPLPFSPISVVAGAVHYPFIRYLLIALSRFLRFFLYAIIFLQFL